MLLLFGFNFLFIFNDMHHSIIQTEKDEYMMSFNSFVKVNSLLYNFCSDTWLILVLLTLYFDENESSLCDNNNLFGTCDKRKDYDFFCNYK